MNLICLQLIITILAASSWIIQSIKFEPLYVTFKEQKYMLADQVSPSTSGEHILIVDSKFDVETACPKQNDDGVVLQILSRSSVQGLYNRCDNPVLFIVKRFPNTNTFNVGFVVYKEDGDSTSSNMHPGFPKTHYYVNLLSILFDISEFGSITVWYTIKFGELLQIEPNSSQDIKYDENTEHLNFDLDFAYDLSHQTQLFDLELGTQPPSILTKVQLAPQDDFYMENWKRASRLNLNTVPMWENLHPQWQLLGIFIRKVARILKNLRISSGTAQLLELADATGEKKPIYLLDKKLSVSKYIWKAVSFHVTREKLHRFGIVFVMYNNPYKTADANINICNDTMQETEWHRYNTTNEARLIHACPMTTTFMSKLQGGAMQNHDKFDLKNLLKAYPDGNGKSVVREIDVIEEMIANGLLDNSS